MTFFKAYLQKSFYYRSNAFLWSLIDIFRMLAFLFVWSAIFRKYSTVAGLNFNQIISYFLLITFIKEIVDVGGGRNTVSDEIYTGQIAFFLLKPFSFLKRVFTEEVGWRSLQFSLFLPNFVLLSIFINKVADLSFNFVNLPIFLISLSLSFFISALLDYLCGIGAFWLVQTTTLFHLKDIFYRLLGGLTIPQDLFPIFIRKINLSLPFYYIFAFPTELMTKNFSAWQILSRLLMQFFWILVLYTIYKILWKKGLQRYETWGN